MYRKIGSYAKIRLLLLALVVPAQSFAQPGCEHTGAYMESMLFDKLSKDLKIDTSTIKEEKTKVELLAVSPISELYAKKLAAINFALDKSKNSPPLLDEESYFESFYDNNVNSITAKYTYYDQHNKKDVFIATSLMNKDECSIRFNGYITLSREF